MIELFKAVGTEDFVSWTRYSPLSEIMAVIWSSEIDWNRFDCLGRYSYDYKYGNMREMSPELHTKFVLSSKPRRSDCTKELTFSDVNELCEEITKVSKE